VSITSQTSGALVWPSFTSLTAGGLGFAGLVLLAIPHRRKKLVQVFAFATAVAGVLLGTLTITACGGSGSSSGPKGTSTLTVTATPPVSQAPVQTLPVTITVQ
jgi:hypothetical protein